MAEPGSISRQTGLLLLLSLLTLCCLAAAESSVPAVPFSGGKVRHFQWDVEYMLGAPDCEERVVMAVNGQFPGPTIRARAGDTIHVDLTNKLTTEGVVIHWHGIRQLGTPWADGTASISQCPISPGQTFTYRFVVDKPGTYFYHGHYGMQRSAGLYGSLIVDVADGEEEPFGKYDGEFNLLLSDWWHRSAQDQEVDLSSNPFRWIGEPQSLLINGRGQFNCSLAAGFGNASSTPCKFRGTEQCAPQILRVLPNKVYRIRLASTTSLSVLNFQIQGHKMVVVEADGNYVQPFTVDDVDINSGESYSVLLSTHNQTTPSNFWISVGVRGRQPKTPPALTLLNYLTSSVSIPTSAPPTTPLWSNLTHSKSFSGQIVGLDGVTAKPPSSATRRVLLLNTQNKLDGFTKWAINNVSLSLPPTPYLGSIKFELQNAYDLAPPPENFPASYDITKPPTNPNTTVGNGVYKIPLNTTVDIILQNANALNPNTSETHPWHLHGHDFWVLGYGEGRFNGDDDMKGLNLKNPPLRNTVVIYPFGWTALRYVADNPGVWAFHCHIEPHLHMGMGVVLAQGVEYVQGIPNDAIACGLTAKFLMKPKA
ncbi:hypothetical protein V2J09_001757 [Rumex salicifolius]